MSVASGSLAERDGAGDEVVDHGGVGECTGVAKIVRVAFGDLTQDAAHNFPATRLG